MIRSSGKCVLAASADGRREVAEGCWQRALLVHATWYLCFASAPFLTKFPILNYLKYTVVYDNMK